MEKKRLLEIGRLIEAAGSGFWQAFARIVPQAIWRTGPPQRVRLQDFLYEDRARLVAKILRRLGFRVAFDNYTYPTDEAVERMLDALVELGYVRRSGEGLALAERAEHLKSEVLSALYRYERVAAKFGLTRFHVLVLTLKEYLKATPRDLEELGFAERRVEEGRLEYVLERGGVTHTVEVEPGKAFLRASKTVVLPLAGERVLEATKAHCHVLEAMQRAEKKLVETENTLRKILSRFEEYAKKGAVIEVAEVAPTLRLTYKYKNFPKQLLDVDLDFPGAEEKIEKELKRLDALLSRKEPTPEAVKDLVVRLATDVSVDLLNFAVEHGVGVLPLVKFVRKKLKTLGVRYEKGTAWIPWDEREDFALRAYREGLVGPLEAVPMFTELRVYVQEVYDALKAEDRLRADTYAVWTVRNAGEAAQVAMKYWRETRDWKGTVKLLSEIDRRFSAPETDSALAEFIREARARGDIDMFEFLLATSDLVSGSESARAWAEVLALEVGLDPPSKATTLCSTWDMGSFTLTIFADTRKKELVYVFTSKKYGFLSLEERWKWLRKLSEEDLKHYARKMEWYEKQVEFKEEQYVEAIKRVLEDIKYATGVEPVAEKRRLDDGSLLVTIPRLADVKIAPTVTGDREWEAQVYLPRDAALRHWTRFVGAISTPSDLEDLLRDLAGLRVSRERERVAA